VGVAVVLRHRTLLALDLVTAIGGAAAVLAISRIYGIPWPYLMFGVFGVTATAVLGIGGAALALLDRLPSVRARAASVVGATGLVLIVLLSVRLIAVAGDAAPDSVEQTARLARLVPPTVSALEAGTGAASGDRGHYLVTWADAAGGGSEGIGMVNELIRHGFDVGVRERDRVQIGPHRVMARDEATAEVVIATGGSIDALAKRPGVAQIYLEDERTAAERADFAEARTDAIHALRGLGREDLVPRVDTDLFGLALNEGLPPTVLDPITRMLDIGLPIGVFIAPVEEGT
jgi:hypothetical protein